MRASMLPMLLATLAACDGAVLDDGLEAAAAPITNGTASPQVTALTRGQELAIGYLASPTGAVFCSGVVIRNDAVLTAYHCVEDWGPSQIRFGVGDPFSPRLIKISKIHRASWETDLAVLRLANDATSIPGLTPLEVNRSRLDETYIGDEVEIAGYAPISDVHQRRYGVVMVTNVYEGGIAVHGLGLTGPCQGDSGGPLLMTEASGKIVVAGTAIGGDVSCRGEAYYSRIDENLAWLDAALTEFAAQGSPPKVDESSLDPWGCGDSNCGLGSTPSWLAAAIGALFVMRRRRAGEAR
jgi:secreted trypsin-like serine protease